MCGRESAGRMERVKLSGRGTIVSYSVVREAPPPYEMMKPYVLAIIEMAWATRGGRAAVDTDAKAYRWGTSEGPNGILEMDPNTRLAVRWPHRGKDTTVPWSLEGKASGTGVYLLQSRLADAAAREVIALRGWWSSLLVDLKNYLEAWETGLTEPYEEQQRKV